MATQRLPVSVVIPAFQRPAMVERALLSVLAQTCQPSEIIVVDDASGDETGARAAALGARVIAREHNGGRGAARNTGLAAAQNEWVALLDCDDEWLPDHLATLWPARGGHVLLGAAALLTPSDPTGERAYGWAGRRPRQLRGPADVAVPENKLVSSAVLIRRDAALAAGGFIAGQPRAEDLDLWVRLLEVGTGLAIPSVTALYHVHSDQISSDPDQMQVAHGAVLERHADRPWHTTAVRRRYEGARAWDGARAALARGAPRVRTAVGLIAQLSSQQRLVGAGQLLMGRHQRRRLAAQAAARAAVRNDPRARWRWRWVLERWIVSLLGRQLRCAACGRPLFRAIPIVWRGEVRLIGAYERLVRVSFRWTDTLEVRHVYLDQCPAPERPWVS